MYVVRLNLKSREQCRQDEAPQIFPPVGKHHARYHGRQIGKGDDLPYMARGNDDEEVAAERPYDGAESRKRLAEIESPEKDVEAEKIGKHIPDILRQPQVVELSDTVEHVGTLVRRCHLIGGHAAEERVGPARRLARTLVVFGQLHSRAAPGRRVMTVKNAPFDVCRKEIGKRDEREHQHCQQVGQAHFQCLH